jgi:predicted helicase
VLEQYLRRLTETANRGDAREESYYDALKEMLEYYCESAGRKGVFITVLPKKTEAGNPDFRIWDGKQHVTGYIEAKDPSIENLDKIEDTPQIIRYRDTFPNLILTNFLEFRLYRNGKRIGTATIGKATILNRLRTHPPVENEDDFKRLLDRFLSFSVPRMNSAKSLAVELAKRTGFLKDEVITQELIAREKTSKGFVQAFYEAFRQFLISSLTKEEFADLYAQTITYGLFAARSRSQGDFNRKLAYDNIPQTIGMLKDLFQYVSLGSLPEQMEWIIDDISEVLSVADINSILRQYFHEGKGKDPVVHFYETFLREYDPRTREMRGVYYTPEPVVSYIVSSLNYLLKKQFKKADGLADRGVTVLDPAGGTLTFLAEATRLAVEEFVSNYGEGAIQSFIREHILKNFHAFELMMAPYAVGHLKMSLLLEELGYKMQKDDRVKLFLTNALEMEELPETKLPGISALSEESHLAGRVKKEQPILVVLGNPPYSVSSVNKSAFIEQEMEVYKRDVRDEKNIQPLSDDYIKFIRFAHWKIEQTGKGIVGMITNNSYLSGLIHRGMRKSLLEGFDEIYILNLHGSSRAGEVSPDGSKDENVFDIQQGVAIALFVKSGKSKGMGKVFYHDLYGSRDSKYGYLRLHDVESTKWERLAPSKPYYFFVKKDFAGQKRYASFWSVRDIFVQYSSGVKTHRDHFVVGFTEGEVQQRMRIFTGDLPDDMVGKTLELKDTRDWKLSTARESVRKIDWKQHIRPYAYRPFDARFICYLTDLIDRGCDRWNLMQNFFEENIALCVPRQLGTARFFHAFVSNKVADMCLVSNGPKETGYLFPLYIYPKRIGGGSGGFTRSSPMSFLEPETDYVTRKPNLSGPFLAHISNLWNDPVSPEQIFCYIYGILYAPSYRRKYLEFLKIDFSRIPLVKDLSILKKVAQYGKMLVDLHLLQSEELSAPIARFQGKGDNKVDRLRYEAIMGRLFINGQQFFEGISRDVWKFRVGSYQVCEKWLKDRKGRPLTLEEIQTYCSVVTAISRTIEIQKKIDRLFERVEENL